MLKVSKLTRKKIKEEAGESVFYRGEGYFEEGRVISIGESNGKIRARVSGSMCSPYTVWIENNDGYLSTSCNCPYEWSFCKHIVAVLLTLLKNKQKMLGLAGSASKHEGGVNIKSYLESLSKEEIVTILLNVSENNEKVMANLKTHASVKMKGKLNTDDILQEIKWMLEPGDFIEYNEMWDFVRKLEEIKERIEGFIDLGLGADACSDLCKLLIEFARAGIEKQNECDDSDGDLGELIISIGNSIAKALKSSDFDQASVAKDLIELYPEAEDQGLEDLVYNAIEGFDSNSLKIIENITQKEMGKRKREDYEWESNFYLLLYTLKLQKKNEKYIKVCLENNKYAKLVEYLKENGRAEDALTYAKEGIKKGMDRKQLEDGLLELYKMMGKNKEALEIAWNTFKKQIWYGIRELEEIAKKLKIWDSERKKVISFLEHSKEKDPELLARLYLEEKDFTKTVGIAPELHSSTALKIARITKNTMPNKALEIYEDVIESTIQEMGDDSYRAARDILKEMKGIYKKMKKENGWKKYFQNVLERHKPKRNLMKILKNSNL